MFSLMGLVTLLLLGDVMTGRGVDQILPYSSNPILHEPYLKSALDYLKLAERASGPIARPVSMQYVWGDALAEIARVAPDVRIMNLETAVTKSDDAWPGKEINYRMHPGNVPVFAAARIDVCSLANNHTLDWGYSGLRETLSVLWNAGIKTAGAGRALAEAGEPAIVPVAGKGRVITFAFGSETSGIPGEWAAAEGRPGLSLIRGLSKAAAAPIAESIRRVKGPGDIVVVSLHWGGNWGYGIASGERELSHHLIDDAGVDVVFGHSSHHVKGIEVYHDRLVLYGAGEFLDDYEGIGGYELYRPDLGLMYFAVIDSMDGALESLTMTPTRIERFRAVRASFADTRWLSETLNREGTRLGTRVELAADGSLSLRWR